MQSLVDALSAAPLIVPDIKNLGITEEWLASKVESQWPPDRIRGDPTTADQEKLFKKTFTNLKAVADIAPALFMSLIYNYIYDYSVFCKVEIVFDDGSKLSAESDSYSVFMLPWSMNGRRAAYNYNADISRALAAFLSAESANKTRLAGDELASELANVVVAAPLRPTINFCFLSH